MFSTGFHLGVDFVVDDLASGMYGTGVIGGSIHGDPDGDVHGMGVHSCHSPWVS